MREDHARSATSASRRRASRSVTRSERSSASTSTAALSKNEGSRPVHAWTESMGGTAHKTTQTARRRAALPACSLRSAAAARPPVRHATATVANNTTHGTVAPTTSHEMR